MRLFAKSAKEEGGEGGSEHSGKNAFVDDPLEISVDL